MEEKNVKRGKACWDNFQVAREEAGENYEKRHSGIDAPPIENIFPSAFLNYSHTLRPASKESFCRTHYRQDCRYERKRRRE